jgi:ribosome-associated protein
LTTNEVGTGAHARAVLCAKLAQEKQALNILILDLTKIIGSPSDYFVIASVESEAQIKAVADLIQSSMHDLDLNAGRIDGSRESPWFIIDFFDVIVHIMQTDSREFYKMERLWGDAKAYELDDNGVPQELATFPSKSASQ